MKTQKNLEPINEQALQTLFMEARTHHAWQQKPVAPALLEKLWSLARMGPTAFNCSPLRIVFVTSAAAKEKLKPALAAGNISQTMSAPVTAILANDNRFFEHLPELFPAMDVRKLFDGPELEEGAKVAAMRNGTLQVGYFILAARALGLDSGPMSGFDDKVVNATFFPGGHWRANILCNLGYGDTTKLYPRGPRLDFSQACLVE